MGQLTLGSLFDGIGGFPYAASFYGIRALWASEVMPKCISVTKRHFPEMVHMGDIEKLHGGRLPPVDIITFGSPCQGLSGAGLRHGLADKRSGLFWEAARIIYEMKEATDGRYPRFALWENVPGALSSAGGRDFKAVLEALTKSEIPMPGSGRWADAGMVRRHGADLAWCVYDAQYFGTAQRRRRLFLVTDFGGRSAGEILFVPKSLCGYFKAGRVSGQGTAAPAFGGIRKAGRGGWREIPRRGVLHCREYHKPKAGKRRSWNWMPEGVILYPDNERPPCSGRACCAPGKQGESPPVSCRRGAGCEQWQGSSQAGGKDWEYGVRHLTPLEWERLQAFPDGWTSHGHDGKRISDTKRHEMLGNSIAIPCAAYIMQGMSQILAGDGRAA